VHVAERQSQRGLDRTQFVKQPHLRFICFRNKPKMELFMIIKFYPILYQIFIPLSRAYKVILDKSVILLYNKELFKYPSAIIFFQIFAGIKKTSADGFSWSYYFAL
jgi:hypothetical protein